MDKTCDAVVYERDTYRVSRGSKSGFAMHYTKRPCKRLAVDDGLCRVHAKVATKRFLLRWSHLFPGTCATAPRSEG